MKRPLAVFGFTYLATSAAAVCFFPEVNFILCVMAAISAIAAGFIFREKLRDILLILCPICAALLVIGCCQLRANHISEELSDQSCVISGEICEIPHRQYGRWRYTIETDRIDIPGVTQKIRILMTSRSSIEEAKEGDRITCEVQFLQSSSETGSHEVGYNSTTSLRADGIKARCWYKPYSAYRLTKGGFRLRYLPQIIRRAIVSGTRKALPKQEAAMLCGMLLGDTGAMEITTVENFRITGIAHLLAVSGLHLTLLTMTLMDFLRKLRVNPKPSWIISICFILLFMAVTGFPPSVVRAGVMHILTLISKIIFRDSDSFTSLSAAALVICLFNPWAAADIGLQLSVCATLGLLLASNRVYAAMVKRTRQWLTAAGKMPQSTKIKRSGKRVIRRLASTVTASLAILPLTAIHFGRVSLISPLTNLLCVYIASLFLMIGIIATAIYCIPLVGWLISLPLRFAAAVLCAYLEVVTGALAKLPFSALSTSFSYTPALFLFILLLVVCAFIMNRYMNSESFGKRLRGFVLCEIAVLLFAGMLSHQLFCRSAEIVVFDTGNGGMCVCARNRTHAFFADVGGDSYVLSVIRQTLRSEGVRKVDAVAVSDESAQRSGNIYRILEQYPPDYLFTDIDLYRDTAAGIIQPFGGCAELKDPALGLETFSDRTGGKWQRLTCGEATALICPEKGDCLLLPDDWRSCDAVIVGKEINGLAAMNVGAIITIAKESKAYALCNRLKSTGFGHVYGTAQSGTISLSVKDGKLRVRTDER